MNYFKYFFCLFCGLLSANSVFSQNSANARVISSIAIEIFGPQTVGKSYIRQNLQVETGMTYEALAIDKSIHNLMDTGTINDVKVYINPKKSNEDSVSLVFQIRTKPRIAEIRFVGNEKLSDKKLKGSILQRVGDLMSEPNLKKDQETVESLYLEKGYWNSRVISRVETNKDGEGVLVIFDIVENDKRKIRRVEFLGNKNLPSGDLLDEMETAPWRFWRFWSNRSKYRPEILEEDIERLLLLYSDRGFLEASIDQQTVSINPVGKSRLDLTIPIREGERSYFGKSTLTGNAVISTEDLLEDTLLKPKQPYSPSVLSNERSRLTKLYGEKGYLDARVRLIRTPNFDTKEIDLLFEITENNKFSVNTIKVRGNEKTKTIVLIRELSLAPGETFDLRRMENDEYTLRNTKLFEKVSLSDEPISSEDAELRNSRRNLVVDVEEGRTGHVGFGIGFSTLEKAMMFAEFRQGNFDIMRWRAPHRLQGDSQKFRLRLKLGSKSNEARLALEEPWFLNRRVAAGFEVFREKSDYQSSYYDELRAGFEIYFRKRLFELVEGRLFYSFEDVLIGDIENTPRTDWIRNDSAYDETSREIKRTISKVGLTLSRDTRDVILFPTEGSIFSIRKEFAGGVFGGDADYGRLELQGARFFQTFDAMEQVLTISGKAGTLGKFDGNDANVPFFDKFFLGGPYNLRGWDYRDAGPKDETDQEEPIGGNSITYASLEYTFKIADPLRFAFFYDAGYLREGDFKLTPGSGDEDWHDNWGLGIRIMVMGMPLRLDLGFPLSDPSGKDSSSQFHFSGGTRF
jgi:outer membrane protein insertion porin family